MSKNLVAFFSASGTTKKVAEMIAEEAKADLFEIEPKVPYTKADLDWMNKKSRSSVEMSDKKYRPEIMKKKMDMSSYDEILLGFPIWWYVAPTIVNTFLEAYDFSGKKIVLFGKAGTMHDWTLDEAESENVIKHALDLLYREDERELLPICKQMKVSLMPYSPLAAGHLVRPQWKSESLRGTTDRVAMGKYDKTEAEDMQIVKRVAELAEKYNCKMSQIAIAWQWAKGILSPIIGATKTQYLDDSAGAFDIKLTAEDLAYLEEPYVPHEIEDRVSNINCRR